MNNANGIEHTAQSAAHLKTNFVVGYYLLTIVTSTIILFAHGKLAFAADLFAGLFYLAVTAVLYDLSHRNGFRAFQKPREMGCPTSRRLCETWEFTHPKEREHAPAVSSDSTESHRFQRVKGSVLFGSK
jgi:hypothetical protein